VYGTERSRSPVASNTAFEIADDSTDALLIVRVKDQNGDVADWELEGGAPGLLIRAGMNKNSLRPGDEIILTINPLRSGANGGSYQPDKVKFKDGTPVAAPRE
jgi:hypothetical protein